MKLEIKGPLVAATELDLIKLKDELKKEPPYKAIKNSIKVVKNDLYDEDGDLIDVMYGEINWGTLFMILDRYPEKQILEIGWFPVQYSGMPFALKKNADFKQGNFEFEIITKDGIDYMMLGKKTMTDPDAWFDAFLGTRFFDSLTKKWEVELS